MVLFPQQKPGFFPKTRFLTSPGSNQTFPPAETVPRNPVGKKPGFLHLLLFKKTGFLMQWFCSPSRNRVSRRNPVSYTPRIPKKNRAPDGAPKGKRGKEQRGKKSPHRPRERNYRPSHRTTRKPL